MLKLNQCGESKKIWLGSGSCFHFDSDLDLGSRFGSFCTRSLNECLKNPERRLVIYVSITNSDPVSNSDLIQIFRIRIRQMIRILRILTRIRHTDLNTLKFPFLKYWRGGSQSLQKKGGYGTLNKPRTIWCRFFSDP